MSITSLGRHLKQRYRILADSHFCEPFRTGLHTHTPMHACTHTPMHTHARSLSLSTFRLPSEYTVRSETRLDSLLQVPPLAKHPGHHHGSCLWGQRNAPRKWWAYKARGRVCSSGEKATGLVYSLNLEKWEQKVKPFGLAWEGFGEAVGEVPGAAPLGGWGRRA